MALDQTHLAQINDALDRLKTAESELALAKRAGLHETPQGQKLVDLEATINEQKRVLQRVKNTYFPNAS